MKTKIIPFDLETAKKIQAGEIEGKIKTKCGNEIRILCFDLVDPKDVSFPIVCALYNDKHVRVVRFTKYGRYSGAIDSELDLVLEVPDNEPQTLQFNSPYSIEQLSKLKDCVKQIMDVNQNAIDNLQNLRKDLKHIWDTEESSNFNSKTLFDKWDVVQNSLNKLFEDNALKNNVKISNSDLIHYAAELFTWLRETHLIFNFRCDKLEELNQYVKEHIMDPSWSNEARRDIKQIFGIETPNYEFKPFDKVLVRNKSNATWHPSLYALTDGLLYYTIDCKDWQQCIPYEGNEHLVGTTDEPKELWNNG